MADKDLSEADWKSFAAKNDVKEAALSKALAQLGKAKKQGPEQEREAAEAVHDAINKLERDFKGNKLVLKRLSEMDDAAADCAKDADKAMEKAAASGDDDEESPELLTKKMIPLVREIRKGEAVMHALITTAGKNTAVLIMRRPISPSKRKMMMEAVDAQGGAKHHAATVMDIEGTVTFTLDTAAAGLAKRARAALLEQTGLRLKVKVRDASGAAEEDGEDEEGKDAAAAAIPQAPPQPPSGPTPEEIYAKRLASMEPQMLAALKAQHGNCRAGTSSGACAQAAPTANFRATPFMQ